MSDSSTILEVKGVSKTFYLREGNVGSAKEKLSSLFTWGNGTGGFKALDNVSFTLKKGEVLGIIGKNGAGKSTLLKVLSGITPPDTGEINFYGKAVSILDIGAGFHPDLSGRENIYLAASLYEVSRAEIDKRYNSIVEFSGIGRFINEPVKNYSSGMYLRLAFAVIAHLDAELMLFDEVISVGDADFQLTVMEYVRRMLAEKKSVIVVTHNPRDIVNLCDRVIEMENGRIKRQGGTEVLADYLSDVVVHHKTRPNKTELSYRSADGEGAYITEALIAQPGSPAGSLYADQPVQIQLTLASADISGATVAVRIGDIRGNAIVSSDTDIAGLLLSGQPERLTCSVPGNFFNAGNYTLSIYITRNGVEVLQRLKNVLQFNVLPNRNYPDTFLVRTAETPLLMPFNWEVKDT